jgi:hypothetical protein
MGSAYAWGSVAAFVRRLDRGYPASGIWTSENSHSTTFVNNALASLTEAGLLLVCNLVSRAKRKGSLA